MMNPPSSDSQDYLAASNLTASLASVRGDSTAVITGTATAMATTTTTTTTLIQEQPDSSNDTAEVLQLTLRARPTVRWDEDVVDNEGMGRKSSKRCCIFHKQRDFGESSTDSSDVDSDNDDSESGKSKKIARPKKSKVPDYQRFHA